MSNQQTMMEKKQTGLLLFRILATILLGGLMWGVYRDMDAWFRPQLVHATRISFTALVAIGFEALFSLGSLTAVWRADWLKPVSRLRNRLGVFRWALLIIFSAGSSFFFLVDKSQIFNGMYARLSLTLFVLGVATWLASEGEENWSWNGILCGTLVFAPVFLFTSRFQKVTNHPFSLFWSEGNRLWDYSIPLGRGAYNYPADESIYSLTDIGRRMLWGIPYLLPGVQIWTLRFWDVLMFTVPYFIFGLVLFRKDGRTPGRWLLFFIAIWTMLFINQGPIYTPLVLAALLVALARKSPLWLNVLLVVIAGYYARTSRYTWMFAPGMWAVMVAILDQDWAKVTGWVNRLAKPVLLGAAGIFGGFLLPELVFKLSGFGKSRADLLSAEGIQSTATQQPLLWDRLFPNSTYAPGILLGLLIAIAPIVAILIYLDASKRWKLHPLQKLFAAAILIAFLGVGLVVSVKIGGGSNLHNLDMFLLGLLFAAGLAWENGGKELFLNMHIRKVGLKLVLAALVLVPAGAVVFEASYSKLPSEDIVSDALAETQSAIAAARQRGEVLFMDQRQLLTFGYAGDVPLVVDYEKKKVMNEAMAENKMYFEQYYQDLANHRFSLIVSEPLRVVFQGDVYQFGNENDAWVKWVSIPTLCYYEQLATYPEVGLELLVPKLETASPVGDIDCPVP